MPMVCEISDCSNQGIGFGHSDSASPVGLGQSNPAAILFEFDHGDSSSPFRFGQGDSAILSGLDHVDSAMVIRPKYSRIRPC